jgi:hypothetical protein
MAPDAVHPVESCNCPFKLHALFITMTARVKSTHFPTVMKLQQLQQTPSAQWHSIPSVALLQLQLHMLLHSSQAAGMPCKETARSCLCTSQPQLKKLKTLMSSPKPPCCVFCALAQAITKPGTRLIELPRSCQLTYDESSDARVLSLIQQVPDELWGAKLALQVLVQRIAGPASHFATYISYLPVGVSGVPMFFPREALEAIEYPPVVEQVRCTCLLCLL